LTFSVDKGGEEAQNSKLKAQEKPQASSSKIVGRGTVSARLGSLMAIRERFHPQGQPLVLATFDHCQAPSGAESL
jgi:hypothetical protein